MVTSTSSRKRLVAARFTRIWALVQEIADRPGQSRQQLSRRFHLSERQVQADLNLIRDDMRLPLVRDGGYRFASEGGGVAGPCPLTLKDGLVAITTLGKALPVGRRGQVADVLLKLPHVFPSHVQPLMRLLTSDVLLEPKRRSCLQPIVAAAFVPPRGPSPRAWKRCRPPVCRGRAAPALAGRIR